LLDLVGTFLVGGHGGLLGVQGAACAAVIAVATSSL
ncbi:MAG: hypothetical protein ACI89L_002829, partial [Phycisphaerales bacterium]